MRLTFKVSKVTTEIAGTFTTVTILRIRLVASILIVMNIWIYFFPRNMLYQIIAITGGVVGFAFIYLIPLLIHFKSRDKTVLLEARLNGLITEDEYNHLKRGSIFTRATAQSEGSQLRVGLSLIGILLFGIFGFVTLLGPLVALLGPFGQNNFN